MSSSGVTMFSSCKTGVTSESADVVPASMDMALTPISTPATCVLPMLAFRTTSLLSPSSMPLRLLMATSVELFSTYSQKATPWSC